mmetsp:Transcript_35604/g.58127  ORF Transcript_35604/g.58127 Transcript_35604/m.58127 type:complete len:100 (-) Transcript_35604:9-308(-)
MGFVRPIFVDRGHLKEDPRGVRELYHCSSPCQREQWRLVEPQSVCGVDSWCSLLLRIAAIHWCCWLLTQLARSTTDIRSQNNSQHQQPTTQINDNSRHQ